MRPHSLTHPDDIQMPVARQRHLQSVEVVIDELLTHFITGISGQERTIELFLEEIRLITSVMINDRPGLFLVVRSEKVTAKDESSGPG